MYVRKLNYNPLKDVSKRACAYPPADICAARQLSCKATLLRTNATYTASCIRAKPYVGGAMRAGM